MERTKVTPERIMRGLRPIQSARTPAKRVEKTLPRENGGDDGGELAGGEAGGGFEVGERAGDDADIDAVEQAAETGDEKKEALVGLVGAGGEACGGCEGHGAGLTFAGRR